MSPKSLRSVSPSGPVHVLSLDPAYMPRGLSTRVSPRRSILRIAAASFTQPFYSYYSLANKLSYVVTVLCQGEIPAGSPAQVTHELCLMNYEFEQLRRMVHAHTPCEFEVVPGSTGMVLERFHQNVLNMVRFEDMLETFLFGHKSRIALSRLDRIRPRLQPTDRGPEDAYEAHYAPLPTDARRVEVNLLLKEAHQSGKLAFANGLEVSCATQLAQQVCEWSVVENVVWQNSRRAPDWLGVDVEDAALAALASFIPGFRWLRHLPIATEQVEAPAARVVNQLKLTLSIAPELRKLLQHQMGPAAFE